ncbi:MAG: hypothetical protein ACKVJK_24455, partial [Methylophagaceae bacterium]
VSGTVDGIDIAARDAVLTSTTTTAGAALPKAGGTMTGDLILGDSIKLELGAGTGGDLQLYHDGSHSYVTNTYASGALKLVSDDFRIENASNRNQLKTGVSGAVQLFFDDGSATGLRLGTTATGVDVTGNIVVSGTVDGVDIQTLNTTAGAALPKAGGTMTGTLAMGANAITSTGTLSSGAITSTGILTLDTSPAANGVGDLVVIPSLNLSAGVGFAGQVFGVNVKNAVHSTHNTPQVASTWGGVTGATAIALQADDNSYGQFQVWTAPQDSSADDLLTPKFYIAGSGAATFTGNVGIGNNSYGSSLGQLRVINDAASAPASLSLFGYNNIANNAEYAKLEFALQESGTGGQVHAKISGLASGTSENAAHLAFYTSAGSLTERMRIDNNGNVGIGTDNPIAPLHVLGNAVIETGSPDLYLATTSASHRNWRVAAQEVVSQGFEIASGTTSAGSNAIADTYNTRFTIKGDTVNVGIGTSYKGYKLDVSGKGRIGNTISVGY